MTTHSTTPPEAPLMPAHWPEEAKTIVLFAMLWCVTTGLFLLVFLLDWLLGGSLRP